MGLFRTRDMTYAPDVTHALRRCLSALDLTLMGIGAIIGAGVFVLTGIAAATKAGPAVCISYVISGFACLCAALSYAELAASIGGCGSAYSYSYAAFGEVIAWIVGWDLLLEYIMSVSTVAIGWAGYVTDAMQAMQFTLPRALTKNMFEGGLINLPAVLIIVLLTTLLCIGVKASSRFNAGIVVIKLFAIAVFVVVATQHINPSYWHPFTPFGWHGVIQGAALVFFAYIGFDAVSTAAEEALEPQRTLPIGIISSVIVCTLLYILVAALLVSIVPYTTLNVASPVANALLNLHQPFASAMVAAGAIAGLTTVMLVMFYGLTRVCLAMARDGLLPKQLTHLHKRAHTPIVIITSAGTIIAILAGIMPIRDAAELVNIGTLTAFTLVCAGVLFLSWRKPDLVRPFKTPFTPLVPMLGVISCFYLMINLPAITWWRFIIWLAIGMIIYFIFGRKHSVLNITKRVHDE